MKRVLNKKQGFFYLLIYLVIVLTVTVSSIAAHSRDKKRLAEAIPFNRITVYDAKETDIKDAQYLEIYCDKAVINFYCWEKDAVKFEASKTSGDRAPEETIRKNLEKIELRLDKTDSDVVFSMESKGKRTVLKNIDISISAFVPKRLSGMRCDVKDGRICFNDDINCVLSISGNSLDVEINKVKGSISCRVSQGDIAIKNGLIRSFADIRTGNGNIRIKSDFTSPGAYQIETGSGLIDLSMPSDIDVLFLQPEEIFGSGMWQAELANEESAHFLLKSTPGMANISRY
jgi:DUF4097 and DUF4098 domain-containing protein YvlB